MEQLLRQSPRVVVATGILMAAADVETYLVSPTFWTKMVMVVAAFGSRRLTMASVVGAVLWLVIVYVSNWLSVAV